MDDSTYIGLKARPRERVDIRIGTERRRRWGREEKLRIVRESLAPSLVRIPRIPAIALSDGGNAEKGDIQKEWEFALDRTGSIAARCLEADIANT